MILKAYLQCSGISYDKALSIKEEAINKKEIYNIYLFLEKYNISIPEIIKIYERFGSNAIALIKENPYILLYVLTKTSFFDVDKIALDLEKVDENTYIRINEYIKYLMYKHMQDGNTIISEDNVLNSIIKDLNIGLEEAKQAIKNKKALDEIITFKMNDKKYLVLKYIDYAQKNIVKVLVDKNRIKIPGIKSFDKKLEKQEVLSKIELTNDQREAIKMINKNSISIITGGPRYW